MSEPKKETRDLLIEMHTDVRWIKTEVKEIKEQSKHLEGRVSAVERKVWYGAGLLASCVLLWEAAKNKLFP